MPNETDKEAIQQKLHSEICSLVAAERTVVAYLVVIMTCPDMENPQGTGIGVSISDKAANPKTAREIWDDILSQATASVELRLTTPGSAETPIQ